MYLEFCLKNKTDHALRLPFLRIPCSLKPSGQKGDSVKVLLYDFIKGQQEEVIKQLTYMVDHGYMRIEILTDLPCNPDTFEVTPESLVEPAKPMGARIEALLGESSLSHSEPGSMMNRVDAGLPVFGTPLTVKADQAKNAEAAAAEKQRIADLVADRVGKELAIKEAIMIQERTLIEGRLADEVKIVEHKLEIARTTLDKAQQDVEVQKAALLKEKKEFEAQQTEDQISETPAPKPKKPRGRPRKIKKGE